MLQRGKDWRRRGEGCMRKMKADNKTAEITERREIFGVRGSVPCIWSTNRSQSNGRRTPPRTRNRTSSRAIGDSSETPSSSRSMLRLHVCTFLRQDHIAMQSPPLRECRSTRPGIKKSPRQYHASRTSPGPATLERMESCSSPVTTRD